MNLRPYVLVLVILAASCDSAPDRIKIVLDYQDKANAHEVEALLDMLAPDAHMDFGPLGTLRGREEITKIHEYDRALGTRIEFKDCSVTHSVVTCRTIETNKWLDTAGIDRLVYDESIFEVTDEGKIASVKAKMSAESAGAMSAVLAEFDTWARAHRPQEYSTLLSSDGRFDYGYDSGNRVLELLRDWRAANPTPTPQ